MSEVVNSIRSETVSLPFGVIMELIRMVEDLEEELFSYSNSNVHLRRELDNALAKLEDSLEGLEESKEVKTLWASMDADNTTIVYLWAFKPEHTIYADVDSEHQVQWYWSKRCEEGSKGGGLEDYWSYMELSAFTNIYGIAIEPGQCLEVNVQPGQHLEIDVEQI